VSIKQQKILLGEDLYLKTANIENLGIPRRCGMFNIKDNKRDKVIKIIKGQSSKNYLTKISHTFPTRDAMLLSS